MRYKFRVRSGSGLGLGFGVGDRVGVRVRAKVMGRMVGSVLVATPGSVHSTFIELQVRLRLRLRGGGLLPTTSYSIFYSRGYVPTTFTRLVRCDNRVTVHEHWYTMTGTTPPAPAIA